MKTTPTLIAAIVALSLSSCHKVEDEKPAQATTASPKLQAVIDAEVEGEAQAIHIARKSAEPGQTLTLKGWVMGHDEPFVQGRAAFILGDPEVITACSERPGDGCTTPWDVCCDDPEDIKRGTVSIQVVNDDGRVLKEGIEGVGGIEKLSKLRVTGTVAEGSTPERLVINASAIDLQ
ncbi:MAG: hypothetical protein ACO3SO_00605 [Luteolibacter sp.]